MDPFLLAHHVLPDFFNIGGRLWPVSVRDQMLRGAALADRLVDSQLLGGERRDPLLVVGAGAGGAAAAIRAAQLGVRTLLVDREPAPFTLQRHCQTRWLDPTQYDWPADHWTTGAHPIGGGQSPLPWQAGWAHQLAAVWQVALHHAAAANPRLIVWYSTNVAAWQRRNPNGWQVTFSNRERGNFAVVVWACGFGSENSRSPTNYRGFAFWETDPFALPNCGLPANEPAKVLISGSGDGALQDFLRIVTDQKSAEEIYLSLPLGPRFGSRIYTAEDVAQRAFQWGPTRRQRDHAAHDALHHAHLAMVDDAWRRKGMKQALDGLVRHPVPSVTLLHSCSHFGQAYGLNRFLVLLLARYLERRRNQSCVLMPGKRLLNVQTAQHNHTCRNDPIACHGNDHDIEIVAAPDCWTSPAGPLVQTLQANVIIIRHGIDFVPAPPISNVAHARQLLPYREFG